MTICVNSAFKVANLTHWHAFFYIRAAFEPFGPLVDVVVTLKPDGNPRGFGFVEYATEEEATLAMEKGEPRQF